MQQDICPPRILTCQFQFCGCQHFQKLSFTFTVWLIISNNLMCWENDHGWDSQHRWSDNVPHIHWQTKGKSQETFCRAMHLKEEKHEADCSPPPTVKLKKEWSCIFAPQYALTAYTGTAFSLIIIIIIIIIILHLSWSWATCWPVLVSRIQKSLQRSTMIPSASWGVVFHYPG